ncbi:AbrB/MazE/SpoVT family DNA-binding domain-containing protein [Ignavibacterium sp.]|uniref:AbrB/MazE/SpoVT family DNA-binding domain-containing protein n=1 Tax=Ignavibacterium sp. TaxID=2651167 RepID=UPI00307DFEC0
MRLAKVTTNGRLTIPAPYRKKYGLYPGRKVKFETDDNGIKIIPLVTPEEVKNNIGFLGTKGKLLKALMEEKKREREW